MNRRLRFASIIGADDVALLPHLVGHYRGLGIESFQLVLNVGSPDDPRYDHALRVAAGCGVPFFHVQFGQWTLEGSRRIFRYLRYLDPDAWYVLADADELHVYDRPLPELVELCEREGFDHVNGCFLDRVAADGGFPALDDRPLWEQFPLAGSVSSQLACALPLKACLVRGHVDLLTAQHGAAGGRPLPRRRSFAQVHHFKWTAGILERLRARVQRFLDDPEKGERWAALEARKFLDRVAPHGDRIDVSDPRLRLWRCGDGYADHPQWPDVAADAAGWQWAIRH
jgi:hypothetical protein